MAAKKPPSTTRFEDRVESYNLANDDLRVWLENRFLAEGYKFDGDKIKLKLDKYCFLVPTKLTLKERDEISTLREVEKDWVLEPEY